MSSKWWTAPRALALAGSLSFALALAGCAPHVRAVVVNASGAPLTELRVAGVQDSTRVRDLAPGESVVVNARVRGEDEIALRGRCGGRVLRPAMAAYVEPGYGTRLTVDGTGAVHVEVRATSY
jgi:hypothetical protein